MSTLNAQEFKKQKTFVLVVQLLTSVSSSLHVLFHETFSRASCHVCRKVRMEYLRGHKITPGLGESVLPTMV